MQPITVLRMWFLRRKSTNVFQDGSNVLTVAKHLTYNYKSSGVFYRIVSSFSSPCKNLCIPCAGSV